MITVVIPSKTVSLLTRAVRSIIRTHDTLDDIEVVVVDDGLSETPAYIKEIRYVRGAKPFCFARNINIGINAGREDSDIFLMNDDAYFISVGGLSALGMVMTQNCRVGVLTPVFARRERTPSQRLGNLDLDHGLWIEKHGYLSFAAVYLRRKLIQEIGLLDESYTGYGFEDNDCCLRAKLKGYDLGVLPSVVMAHGDEMGRASATFGRDARMAALFRNNKERFIRKWGTQLLGVEGDDLDKLILLSEMV